MTFYTWFIEVKLMLRAKLNYKRLNKEYLKNKRRKAAEEIKQLENFTQWPTAKAKQISNATIQQHHLTRKEVNNKLHYLPFYPYQRKSHDPKQTLEKTTVAVTNKNKVNKQL